jgi:pSer/pThr/pTyr-binding forkhead associated (FHA) protein
MSEGLLTLLKFCLLALVYLFLARVMWVVTSELRGSAAVTPVAAGAPATRAGRARWRLAVVEPEPDRGQVFHVEGELTVGRAGGCGIPLAGDTYVSQVHARVFERDGDLYVEDLGSTNGTYVNGTKISEPTRLRRADRVQIGGTVLEAAR